MNAINYQKVMEELIRNNCSEENAPTLLLHSCCAPCSSYCISCLAEYFHVAVFYYNPNIYPPEEFQMRAAEQKRFVDQFPTKYPVSYIEAPYEPDRFYEMAQGMEEVPEGGERCFACYEMRLRKSAEYALAHGFDFFTTTLSISPLKNAAKLNEIGAKLAEEYDIKNRQRFQESTRCIVNITADVFFPRGIGTDRSRQIMIEIMLLIWKRLWKERISYGSVMGWKIHQGDRSACL